MKSVTLTGKLSADFEWPETGPTLGGVNIAEHIGDGLGISDWQNWRGGYVSFHGNPAAVYTGTPTKNVVVMIGVHTDKEIPSLEAVARGGSSDEDASSLTEIARGGGAVKCGEQGYSASYCFKRGDLLDELDKYNGKWITLRVDEE